MILALAALIAALSPAPSAPPRRPLAPASADRLACLQGLALDRYERIGGRRLAELLRGTRMHDPECAPPHGGDPVFLGGGRLRVERADGSTLRGSWRIVGDLYCIRLRGRGRCYELWEHYGAGAPWIQVPAGARLAAGRIVHLIPAGR